MQQLFRYLLAILAFTIPFPFIFSAIGIGVVALVWLLQLNAREVFTNLWQRKILLAWILLYVLFAISYTYSENKDLSALDLQTKFSLLLFPIVIGTRSDMTAQNLERIFLGFVAGVSVIAAYLLFQAGFSWYQNRDTSVFFYHSLTSNVDANAVYEAWYTVLSLTLLLFFKWRYYFKGKQRYLKVLLLIVQLVFFLLLSSRLLIGIFFLFLIPYYAIRLANTSTYNKNIKIIGLTVATITIILLLFTNNPIKDRYKNFFTQSYEIAWLDDYTGVSEGDFSNFTLRIFLWRMGFENIREHHLWLKGAGNGDVTELQNRKMAEHHFINMQPDQVNRSPFYNINLHNMFLQTLMSVGIFGLICFIIITFTPFLYLKDLINNHVFLIFHITAILFMMQEASLQTQAGVVYYSFISCVFWAYVYTQKMNKSLRQG